jgi:hypothetical protein
MLGEPGARSCPDNRAVLRSVVRALLVRNPGSPELDDWLAKAERAAAADSARTMPDELRTSLALTRTLAALLRGDLAASTISIDALQAAAGSDALSAALGTALQHFASGASEAALRCADQALNASESGERGTRAWLRAIVVSAALDLGQRDRAAASCSCSKQPVRRRDADRAMQRYLRGWLAALDGTSGACEDQGRGETALEAGLPWLNASHAQRCRAFWPMQAISAAVKRSCAAPTRSPSGGEPIVALRRAPRCRGSLACGR